MSNDQDENNSKDQMSHHRIEENDGTRENNVSSTSSYAGASENGNKSTKRKNSNESGSFYKKTCFEATGSDTAGKQMDSEDYKMMAPMENQNLSLTVKNFFENYLVDQERLCKDVIQGAKNQQNSESSLSGSIYSKQSPSPFQENKIANRGENFDLSTSKDTETNLDENTIVKDFRGNFFNEDDKGNRTKSLYSENRLKKCTAHERENSPSNRKMCSTSIFSELSSEMTANNRNVTIPLTAVTQEAIAGQEAEIQHGNKTIDTSNINLGTPGEMRIYDTKEQMLLPMNGVSYSDTINNKTFILNDKVPNVNPEMKESRIDDAEPVHFKVSDVEGPKETISLDERTYNRAVKLNKETYSPDRQSSFSEQDNVSPTAMFKLNSNIYSESIILTGSGTLCSQVEERPIILDENTDLCSPNKECTIENVTRSRNCIIINSLANNQEENERNNLKEYEIKRLENDNCKMLTAGTLQLREFKTDFGNSDDTIMNNDLNPENNNKMNNDQNVNNHKSTDQISNLGTGQNDRNQENIVFSTSSYEITTENRKKPIKRKNTNKSDSFCKKIFHEVNESGTTRKQMHSEGPMEYQNQDMEWNCEEPTYSENSMKFQKCSFTAHERENLPNHHILHPTSIISELPNEISNSLNETNNINKTEDFEDQSQRAFISEVFRENLRKSNIEFLFLPPTSVYQCIENNESFTIAIKDMILINKAKKFTGNTEEHENKVNNTSSINLGAPGEMRINDNEKQTVLPTDDVSYFNTNDGKTFILNVEDELPNNHSEMTEELSTDDNEAFNFRTTDVEGPNRYQEVISFDEINCNKALKWKEETYSSYQQSISSEQNNVGPKAMFKLNSTNKYSQAINKSEEKNTYLESIISTCSGTLCDQVEKPMILHQSTDPCISTPDKEYSSCLLNSDYLENITRFREFIITNNLVDNFEGNDTNHLEEFEIGQLENDNRKIITSETFQLNEFKTGFETSSDIIMPIPGILEQNNVPTAIKQETTAQSYPNFPGSSSTRTEIQGGISTEDRIEPIMTNTKLPSTNIPDVVPESCIVRMTRLQVPQNFSDLQSSTNVTRKSTKVKENKKTINIKENRDQCKFIINKLTLEYIQNKTLEEFTIHDIVKFVMAHNSSLPFINVLQSIRSSLEDYTKTGILNFKTNGKYKIVCDGTHQSFATCSKKEKTGIEKSSNRNHRSKQNIENNHQDARNSIQATSHLTALNDSIL